MRGLSVLNKYRSPSQGSPSGGESEASRSIETRQLATREHFRSRLNLNIKDLPVCTVSVDVLATGMLRTLGLNVEPEYVEPLCNALTDLIAKLRDLESAAAQRKAGHSAEILHFPPGA